ncbi:MAG: hypothetical protein WKF97_05385 [Chitinophagaceae bacterium]
MSPKMASTAQKTGYTLLTDNLLDKLRQYYVAAKRPKQYLFTSAQTGKAVHPCSMQLVVTGAMKKEGFEQKGYTSHTLRHPAHSGTTHS